MVNGTEVATWWSKVRKWRPGGQRYGSGDLVVGDRLGNKRGKQGSEGGGATWWSVVDSGTTDATEAAAAAISIEETESGSEVVKAGAAAWSVNHLDSDTAFGPYDSDTAFRPSD